MTADKDMTAEFLPLRTDVGSDFDPASEKRFLEIQDTEFENTRDLGIKTEDFGVEWKLHLPEKGVGNNYTQKGEHNRYKFTKEGRVLAKQNFNIILATAGNEATISGIKQTAKDTLEKVRGQDWVDERYLSLMERSFNARVRDLETAEIASELTASNSPWNNAVQTINEHYYNSEPYAENFNLAANPINDLKFSLKESVDAKVQDLQLSAEEGERLHGVMERFAANYITAHLPGVKGDKLKNWQEKGSGKLIANIFDRFSSQVEGEGSGPVDGFVDKTFDSAYQESQMIGNQIQNLTADAVGLEKFRSVIEEEGSSDKWTRSKAKLKEKLSNIIPTKEKLAVVRGVLALGAIIAGKKTVDSVDISKALASTQEQGNVWISPEAEFARNQAGIDTSEVLPPTAAHTPVPESVTGQEPSTVDQIQNASLVEKDTGTFEDEKIVYPIPEWQVNEKMMIGPMSLEKNFAIVVPEEIMELIDLKENGMKLEGEQIYNMNVTPVSTYEGDDHDNKTIPDNMLEDWQNNPNGAGVIRTEIENNNTVWGHDQMVNGVPLPFEWMSRLYEVYKEHPELIVGKTIKFMPDPEVQDLVLNLKIKGMTEVSAEELEKADAFYSDPPESPAFFNLGWLGFDDQLRLPHQVHLVSCSGEIDPDIPALFPNRIFLTLELVEDEATIEMSEQNEVVDENSSVPDYSTSPEVQKEFKTEKIRETTLIDHLAEDINEADDAGVEHGQEFAEKVRESLVNAGVEITRRLDEMIVDIARETQNKAFQCLEWVKLANRLPGMKDKIVDVGGWTVQGKPAEKASDLLLNPETGKKFPELQTIGKSAEAHDASVIRVDKVSMLNDGDIFVTAENHMGVVTRTWEENGKWYAEIADANFRQDGKVRIEEITDEDMMETLTGVDNGVVAVVRKGTVQQELVAAQTNN